MDRVRTWLRRISRRGDEVDGEDQMTSLPFIRRSDATRGGGDTSEDGGADGTDSIASGCVQPVKLDPTLCNIT